MASGMQAFQVTAGCVRLSAGIALACLLAATGCGQPATQSPNVVVLLADDLGYGSVSWLGGDIPTPNIDSIAARGAGFASGYVTAPVCNPSRPAILTGRYQQRWGKELNSQQDAPIGAPRKALPQAEVTLARTLQRAGYATGAVGKWQLGMSDGYHPLDRGFDYFLGMPSGSRYVKPEWPNARIAPNHDDDGASDGSGRARSLFLGREPLPFEEYLTDRLGRAGVEFIEANAERPFLLYLAFHAPHTPIQTIDKYYSRFPDIEDETARVYAGMISALDDWVGAVLDALRKHQLEENTLVFFLSDNGAAEGSDRDGRRNYPLTGHKRNLYEGGIRVPFALQWPSGLAGIGRYEQPVSSLDIVPTALAATGVPPAGNPASDGVDLLPYLRGEREGAPHRYLLWRSGPNAAVRSGPWKALLAGGVARLYDVGQDPGESRDLSGENPGILREMREALDRWARDKGPSREGSRKVRTRFNGDRIEWHI